MGTTTMRASLVAILFMAAAACGGDDDGGGGFSCDFGGCGGDVVGTWTFADTCLDGTITLDECPAAVVNVDVAFAGSLTFNADMTMVFDATSTSQVSYAIPTSCLMGFTCAQLDESAEDLSCSEAGDVCNCTGTSSNQIDSTGSWTTAGDVLTISQGGGDPDTATYCVAGDTLRMRIEPEDAGDPTVGFLLTR
jgi:hypothetical protein